MVYNKIQKVYKYTFFHTYHTVLIEHSLSKNLLILDNIFFISYSQNKYLKNNSLFLNYKLE